MTDAGFRLDGKITVVTGAASGIGKEIATLFAAQGSVVVLTDLASDLLESAAESIGPGTLFKPMDVTNSPAVNQVLKDVYKDLGGLDILVNNAGISLVGTVEETSDVEFERLMAVNVTGVFNGCRHAVPLMKQVGSGCIINMGSVAGMVGLERRFAYSASKGAVIAMSRQLAIEYVTYGIRVNCICPGTVYTPFVEGYLQRHHARELPAAIARLEARQPMGRMGAPREIAGAALYLASAEAAFVTGSVLTIDGGLTAR